MYFWGNKKTGFGIAMKKSAGRGILVKKERECGTRNPPSRPCVLVWISHVYRDGQDLLLCRYLQNLHS